MTVTIGWLHAGSSSKAILAAPSDREVGEFLRTRPLEALTPHTLVTREAVLAEIGRIRSLGYAESVGERQSAAGSVAAAVLRSDGTVLGSVSICATSPASTRPPAPPTAPSSPPSSAPPSPPPSDPFTRLGETTCPDGGTVR
nr:IclR family transcriptional regulator C-terminal domain-containing protein [Rhizohabitans arisaemae]